MNRIPVFEPILGAEEVELALECLRSGEISGSRGSFLERFEGGWAEYCGRRHGVAVSSGTAALELAFASLDLPEGAEVVVPTFTILSCVAAVLRAGLRPVLVDSEPETGCLDVGQVEARLTPRTRALLAVHTYGHPVDMDPLLALAQARGLHVVEDAAEAHGAEYLVGHASGSGRWRRAGSFGTLSTFSFYANKPITTGEGGMVLTDDARLAARLRSLRNLGFGRQQRFLHEEVGWNYRLTNLQAAIGVAQIAKVDEVVARKRRLAATYTARLGGLDGLQLPVERAWAKSIFWMYAIALRDDAGLDAAALAVRLDAAGIETRPFFLGMHEQPALLRRGLFAGERYPVAERLSRRGLYLPSSPALDAAAVERVAGALESALR